MMPPRALCAFPHLVLFKLLEFSATEHMNSNVLWTKPFQATVLSVFGPFGATTSSLTLESRFELNCRYIAKIWLPSEREASLYDSTINTNSTLGLQPLSEGVADSGSLAAPTLVRSHRGPGGTLQASRHRHLASHRTQHTAHRWYLLFLFFTCNTNFLLAYEHVLTASVSSSSSHSTSPRQ